MIGIVIELVLAYVQYASVVLAPPEDTTSSGGSSTGSGSSSSDTVIPAEWKEPMQAMAFFNLGFDVISGILTALKDIRVYFMVVSVLVPLGFVMLGMLFLSKKRVVLWYFISLTCFMTMCCGAFAKAIGATSSFTIDPILAEKLLYAGLAGLVVCWLIFLCAYKGCCGKVTEDTEKKINRRVMRERETSKCKRMEQFQLFMIAVVMLLGGLILTGLVTTLASSIDGNTAPNFALGMGGLALGISIFLFIWFFMGLFRRGREALWVISDFFHSAFLKLLLLSLSSLYIPIGATTFLIFNCNSVFCPDGYRLPDENSQQVIETWTNGGKCVPCTLPPIMAQCPSTIYQTACRSMSGDRLETDVGISCAGMKSFFWPAGVLIIIMYLIGVPLLFFQLIRVSTKMLHEDFPIREPQREEGESDFDYAARRWELKVAFSSNSSKFLFVPFEHKYRYARLIQLLQKLIVVFTSVFVVRTDGVSPRFLLLGFSLAVHASSCIFLGFTKPFILDYHDHLALVLSITLSLICIFAIIIAAGVALPGAFLIFVMVVNFLVPILGTIFGLVLFFKNRSKEREAVEMEAIERAEAEAGVAEAGGNFTSTADFSPSNAITIVPPALLEAPPTVTAGGGGGGKGSAYHHTAKVTPSGGRTPTSGALSPVDGAPVLTEKQIRKRERLRSKVKAEIAREMDMYKEAQADSDEHIDRKSQAQLRIFMMGGGVFGILALGFCILGLLSKQGVDLRHNAAISAKGGAALPVPDMAGPTQIAGYLTFTNFTSECCCTYSADKVLLNIATDPAQQLTNRRTGPVIVEKWLCTNNVIQERVRSVRIINATGHPEYISGESMRPTCSATFTTGMGCFVATVPGTRNLVFNCTGAWASTLGIDKYAGALW